MQGENGQNVIMEPMESRDSAVTQGGRRPTGVTAEEAQTEVVARKTRKRHTLAYKLRVVETVATLRSEGSGALGAYLRKEGLYYATVRAWERLHASGALTAAKQGPKEKSRQALLKENQRLRRKNEQLEKKLAKTEL